MPDTPSRSATSYEPLCGVVPGVLQQVPCQVATVKVLCIRLHKQHEQTCAEEHSSEQFK